jgi:N-formylglutamate amidohydrolase
LSFSFSSKEESFRLYSDFHAKVSNTLVKQSGIDDDILLIDCHSFSQLPNLLNSNPPDIDICIGYNDDETCPNNVVIGNIARFFESFGYKVGINEPFSNSKTFSVPIKYHSVMIEINKRLYMDEETLEKKEDFMWIHQILQSLYKILLRKS